MHLTYLFNSGFVLETDICILVFDYWKDPANVMEQVLSTTKPVYVFSSHFHEDHFTTEIFSWRNKCSQIKYILSKDILRHKRAQKEDADAWLAKGATFEDELVKVYATGSTDSGVSWVVNVCGKCIFHAGDLNNWYSRYLTPDYKGGLVESDLFGTIDPLKIEKQYLGELKDIKKIVDSFEVAMFPIDARTGDNYSLGARQFIKQFKVGLLVPMHFYASGFESLNCMQQFIAERQTQYWTISKEGDSIII